LDLLQEIFALSVWTVSIEITKRVEMRKVIGFVALFLPTGLVVCASGPLVNAALDRRDCKGYDFEWDRVEVFMKDNADVILVLEPRDIDNFLNYGVSIWITWALAKVEISVNESCLGQQRLSATYISANAIRSSTGVKLIRRIYGVFDICFHDGEKLHAITFNLVVLA
jgi:hypothetical protein